MRACILFSVLVVSSNLGCQREERDDEARGPSRRPTQAELVDRLHERADVIARYEAGEGNPPRFLVLKPEQPHPAGTPSSLTFADLEAVVAGIAKRDLALVCMGKRPDPWSTEAPDEIESMFRRNGFRKVVICQDVGLGPTPILRRAADVDPGIAPGEVSRPKEDG